MGDEALARKLGLKAGQRVCVVDAPDGYVDRLDPPAATALQPDGWSALRFRPAAEVGT